MATTGAAEQVFLFYDDGTITIRAIAKAGRCCTEDGHHRYVPGYRDVHWGTVVTDNELCAINQGHKRLQVCSSD